MTKSQEISRVSSDFPRRFLYPPEVAATGSDVPILDGSVSSIRWEMLRDGIEDVDYLYILRSRLEAAAKSLSTENKDRAQRLLDVPAGITRNAMDYTFDSEPIYEHRRKVAEMIEVLSGASQR